MRRSRQGGEGGVVVRIVERRDACHSGRGIAADQPGGDEGDLVAAAFEGGGDRAHVHRGALVAEEWDAAIGAYVQDPHAVALTSSARAEAPLKAAASGRTAV